MKALLVILGLSCLGCAHHKPIEGPAPLVAKVRRMIPDLERETGYPWTLERWKIQAWPGDYCAASKRYPPCLWARRIAGVEYVAHTDGRSDFASTMFYYDPARGLESIPDDVIWHEAVRALGCSRGDCWAEHDPVLNRVLYKRVSYP